MAVITVSILGGNWNAVTTWVGGVVPSPTLDTVAFTATSGNLTVNVASTCIGIDFTNYVNTITFTALLTINGFVNLGTGGYTQVGASGIQVAGTFTLTSGGVTWSRLWTFAGGGVFTLADNWNFTGILNFSNTGGLNINGNTINTLNLTSTSASAVSGTTNIVFNGTGTWSNTSTGAVRNNITINTTGTLTISGNVYYNTGTLTYIAGTVVSTGSVLNISLATTINTSGMTWRDVAMSNGIQTLTSDLNTEILRINSGGNVTINNSSGNVYILESLIHNSTFIISGTASINLIGTGTWIHPSTGAIRNNLNINTSGTLTISGNVYYNTGTLTYISGTVDASGSTLNIALATTLNTSGMIWNNVTITSGIQTLTSDLNIQNFTSGGGGSNTINGLFNVNVSGNSTANGLVFGTATIVLIGTGLWTALNGSNTFRIPIIINTNGVITLANTLECGGNLTYIKGTVKANNTTIGFATCTLINLHKMVFKNVVINVGSTVIMNEFFSGSPSIVTNIGSNSVSNYTITFQDGFEKISKFVNISSCTLSKPLQLLVITKSKINSRNSGIRYINQSPNGIAKGEPSVNQTTFGANGLLPDPINL